MRESRFEFYYAIVAFYISQLDFKHHGMASRKRGCLKEPFKAHGVA